MNLARLAAEAASKDAPVRAGLIGAGKFGSMFLSQIPTIDGLTVTTIADLSPLLRLQPWLSLCNLIS